MNVLNVICGDMCSDAFLFHCRLHVPPPVTHRGPWPRLQPHVWGRRRREWWQQRWSYAPSDASDPVQPHDARGSTRSRGGRGPAESRALYLQPGAAAAAKSPDFGLQDPGPWPTSPWEPPVGCSGEEKPTHNAAATAPPTTAATTAAAATAAAAACDHC